MIGNHWLSLTFVQFHEVAAKIFSGPPADSKNSNEIVRHNFVLPIIARYISFYPSAWKEHIGTSVNTLHICMKVEIYGCDIGESYSSGVALPPLIALLRYEPKLRFYSSEICKKHSSHLFGIFRGLY